MSPAICMTEKDREEFEDDGRTICNMDVDGMPQPMFHVTREKIRKNRALSGDTVRIITAPTRAPI